MDNGKNILVCDEAAFYLHMHTDGPRSIGAAATGTLDNPLERCASNAEALGAFNTKNPLYGGEPVDVLVTQVEHRRSTSRIKSHMCNYTLPTHSFFKLRDELYIATPEFLFAQMGYGRSEAQLARIGTDLCARYYIHVQTEGILNRSCYLATPDRLKEYLDSVQHMRGASKALRALRWVTANSGSPAETQMALLFRMSKNIGGFGLPFDAMNFNVAAGRFASLAEQGTYCIDLVNTASRVGVEYDGCYSHPDASADKRRRNALLAMGWNIFAIDKNVLHDPDATDKSARQLARQLGIRLRFPTGWEARHLKLRDELGLPAH